MNFTNHVFVFLAQNIGSVTYGYSSESFVFTFEHKASKIPVYNKNKAICYYRRYGPCFGQSELYYVRTSNYGSNYKVRSSIRQSYKSTLITVLASGNRVDDVEVFYMI